MAKARLTESIYKKLEELRNQGQISTQDIRDFKDEIGNVGVRVNNYKDTNRAIGLMDPALKEKYNEIISAINPQQNFQDYLTAKDKYNVTYKYFEENLGSDVSKEEGKKLFNEIQKVSNRYDIPLDTPQNFQQVMNRLKPETISKYSNAYNTFAQGVGLAGLEEDVGSATAGFIQNNLSTEAQEKTFANVLDQVKKDPKFNEFFDQYKNWIKEDYNLNVESVEKMAEFTEEEIDLQRDDAETQFENLKEDVEQYKQYSKDDYIRNLAQTDQDLANSLQKASETYGQRNLLQSGVARIAKQQQIKSGTMQKNLAETQLERDIAEAGTRLERGQEALRQSQNRLQLQEEKSEFTTQQDLKKLESQKERNLTETDIKQTSQAYDMANRRFANTMNTRMNQAKNLLK